MAVLESLPQTKEEATQVGAQYFYTGNACVNGHLSERYARSGGCAKCCRESVRKSKQKYPDKARERVIAWRSKNPDKVKQMGVRFREKNREDAKLRSRLWRASDPDRARKLRNESRARHPEVSRKAARDRKLLKRGVPGKCTRDDLSRIMKMQNGRCAHCQNKFGLRLKPTVDHIVALVNGGTNFPNNIQYLCGPCNSSKGSRDMIEFSRTAGRLL